MKDAATIDKEAKELTFANEKETKLWDNWQIIAKALTRSHKGYKLIWRSLNNDPFQLTRYIAYGVSVKDKTIYWQCLPIKDQLSLQDVVISRLDEMESWSDKVYWFGKKASESNIFDLKNCCSVLPTLNTSIGGKLIGTGPLMSSQVMGLEKNNIAIDLPDYLKQIKYNQ